MQISETQYALDDTTTKLGNELEQVVNVGLQLLEKN